jgi:pimeloyl-ACP methyl ester carboxylesterase
MTIQRTDQKMKLRDGRILGYSEFGDPEGKPVFMFHGHPGSRREFSAFDAGDVAAELNARVIAVDRPGHGLSDFKPGRQILDWPDDVTELADALSVGQFAVLGVSGGGPYAAACAFKIPERLSATAIVSGMGPADAPGVKDGPAWFAAGKSSWVRRLMLILMSFGLRKKPEKFISKMHEAMTGPDKALLLAKPQLAGQVVENQFVEAFRSGVEGVHHEAGLFARPWGFRLQDITAEVHLWHGGKDNNVAVSVGHFVAGAIPNCQAIFHDDEGHLSLVYNHMRDILNVLVA